jgi:hypothetical protein
MADHPRTFVKSNTANSITWRVPDNRLNKTEINFANTFWLQLNSERLFVL